MSPPGGLAPPGDVVEAGLAASRGAGCVVLVHDRSEADVRFAVNRTTTNGVRRARTVTVATLGEVDGRATLGVASRSGAVDVTDLVRAAEAVAAASAPVDDAAPLLGGTVDGDFGEAPGTTDLSVLADVVAGLGGAFDRAEAANRVLAGFATHEVETTHVGTSEGLRRRHVQPTGSLEVVARTADGTGSAWASVGTADFADVTTEALEAELDRRLAWGARRVEVPAGRHAVVLPPSAVADLMVYLWTALGGQDAEDGHTVFSRPGGGTRVGDELSGRALQLRSDPAEPGLACAPFLATSSSSANVSAFDNGLAHERTAWIDGGRLERLLYHRAGAARHGARAASPIGNLVLEEPGAAGTTEDLVSRTERGLLVTCLWYIREVDPATLLLTGLTRDGVYRIEDGEVTGAVTNFRFNESPVDLLGRAADVGATVRTLGREFSEVLNRTAMPPVRVDDFNMSTVSPAS
ncbi:MAG TPA: metallopeptidase TldD-related protein [Acidimicrobiales bacterium]|nr:metallopeptidase TldD-related protein [Acidimicrobiales bacterium]